MTIARPDFVFTILCFIGVTLIGNQTNEKSYSEVFSNTISQLSEIIRTELADNESRALQSDRQVRLGTVWGITLTTDLRQLHPILNVLQWRQSQAAHLGDNDESDSKKERLFSPGPSLQKQQHQVCSLEVQFTQTNVETNAERST